MQFKLNMTVIFQNISRINFYFKHMEGKLKISNYKQIKKREAILDKHFDKIFL